jgi:hypothetical protein
VKITGVDVSVLRVPVERPYLAGGRTVDANWHVLALDSAAVQRYRIDH